MTGSSKGKVRLSFLVNDFNSLLEGLCVQVLIIDAKTLKVLMSFKLTGNAIKSIEFARRGR